MVSHPQDAKQIKSERERDEETLGTAAAVVAAAACIQFETILRKPLRSETPECTKFMKYLLYVRPSVRTANARLRSKINPRERENITLQGRE